MGYDRKYNILNCILYIFTSIFVNHLYLLAEKTSILEHQEVLNSTSLDIEYLIKLNNADDTLIILLFSLPIYSMFLLPNSLTPFVRNR